MLKKVIKKVLIAVVVGFYFYFYFIYDMSKNEKWLNDEICNFAKHEVKSKIVKLVGHGRYQRLKVQDSTYYYYQFSKILDNSFGNNKTFSLKVGDSIAKEPNSKKVIVYRGDKKSVFLLRCEN